MKINIFSKILKNKPPVSTLVEDGNVASDDETEYMKTIDSFVEKYEAAMEDDLNTADAISVIFEIIKHGSTGTGIN